jgi:hypothetical protein
MDQKKEKQLALAIVDFLQECVDNKKIKEEDVESAAGNGITSLH